MANSIAWILSKLRFPLAVSLGGTGKSFIEGLYMTRNSTSSITLSEGSAYIPGLGAAIELSAPITLSGLTLTGNTWYHMYLYSNAGVTSAEFVAVAPAAPYFGKARHKTGDTSRRYVGSARTAASGSIFNFVQADTTISYREHQADAPFQVIVNGAATVPTLVDCNGPVPITGTHWQGELTDASAAGTTRIANPDGGIVSINYNQITLQFGTWMYVEIRLSAARTFSYIRIDAPVSSNFIARTTGYKFER